MKTARKIYRLTARDRIIELGRRTLVMGVVNVTPDSFSGDGTWEAGRDTRKAVTVARRLIREGADILDIGGESTRPGAPRVAVTEEIARVVPVIRELSGTTDVPISVDTYKSQVAREALKAGACLVNTIKGTPAPAALLKIVARFNAAIVLTHIQGTPKSMQKNPHYGDVIAEISAALKSSVENCLETGIKSDKIIIDPGIGFGKTVAHNLMILNRLRQFGRIGVPVLIGTSRKSFIGRVLDRDVDRRLPGTLATVTASIMNGAHIVRVHDVAAARDAARMTDAILTESGT